MLGGQIIQVQRVTEVSDGQGGFIQGWAVIATERGRVRPASGSERLVAHQLQSEVSHIAYLRASIPVQAGDRLIVKGICLNVKAVLEPGLAGRFIEVACVQVHE